MDGLDKPKRYLAIFAISCGTALMVMDGALPNVALPTIAREMNIDSSSAIMIVSVYQLVLVMTLLPLSALGSRIGLRKMYQLGLCVFIGSALLCFLAPNLPLLLAARALQALGAAAALSVGSALVRAIYPFNQLGRGLGFNTIIVASAAAVAPILGGYIVSVVDWHWIFVATVPLGLLALVVGQRALPDVEGHDQPISPLGALLCALAFGLTISGLLALARGDHLPTSLTVLILGALATVVFVRRELTQALPILPVDLLADRVVALSIVGAQFAFIGSMTFILSLPFRLQEHFGFLPSEVGAAIAPFPLAMMVTAPLAGMLSDRYHPGILGGIGMAIATAGMLLLALIPEGATQIDIAWRMAVCGAGYGLFLSPNAKLVISAAPIARAASAGGLISTNRLAGQALGAALVAALLATGHGSDSSPAVIGAVLTFLAGICSIARLSNGR
ncbi:MFS transporter [Halieaceae bacterium IMCC14734]|uniref:MFS transporter n=1 Tax=Candidatus Litorirhabdus singularis TaxID=2518993 RepID=A0ABT3TME3_9GAMM|nr:MFS transporter [Candidatus Litorirhabdus singularis]MCX2982925.1 MFS transporter [Candidatus Litorirhabdus singularis]